MSMQLKVKELYHHLAELSNVILTPHIGATTVDTQREIGCRIFEIVDSFRTDSTLALNVLTKYE